MEEFDCFEEKAFNIGFSTMNLIPMRFVLFLAVLANIHDDVVNLRKKMGRFKAQDTKQTYGDGCFLVKEMIVFDREKNRSLYRGDRLFMFKSFSYLEKSFCVTSSWNREGLYESPFFIFKYYLNCFHSL